MSEFQMYLANCSARVDTKFVLERNFNASKRRVAVRTSDLSPWILLTRCITKALLVAALTHLIYVLLSKNYMENTLRNSETPLNNLQI